MNGSVRDASVLFQLHDKHSSITLNQLSHFFNQGNSGNYLTALRMYRQIFLLQTGLKLTLPVSLYYQILKYTGAIHQQADPSARAVEGMSLRPLLAGIADSNPGGAMDVFLLRVLCVVR